MQQIGIKLCWTVRTVIFSYRGKRLEIHAKVKAGSS